MKSNTVTRRNYLSEAKNYECYRPYLSVMNRVVREYPELMLAGLFLITTLVIAYRIKTHLVLPDLTCGTFINLHYILPLLLTVLWNLIAVGIIYLKETNDKPILIFKICLDQYVRIFSFVIIIWLHFHIKSWIPLINNGNYDEIYYKIDLFCSPVIDKMTQFRQLLANYLPCVDSLYLNAFILMFFLSLSVHALSHRNNFRQVFFATLLVQALGPLCYLIMPAVGPFIYDHSLNDLALKAQDVMWKCYTNIKIFGPEWFDRNGARNFIAGLAAMPSLHIAASWVFVYYAYKYAKYLLVLYIPLFLWILVEAVAAEWHYLIDLPAGLLLGGFCIWLSNKVYGKIGLLPSPNCDRDRTTAF